MGKVSPASRVTRLFIAFLAISSQGTWAATEENNIRTATIYHIPASPSLKPTLSQPKPTELAVLTYNPDDPSQSSIKSFTPPPLKSSSQKPAHGSSDDELLQILIYLPHSAAPFSSPPSIKEAAAAERYRTTTALASSLHEPYKGRFQLLLDPTTGLVQSAAWRPWLADTSAQRENKKASSQQANKKKSKDKAEPFPQREKERKAREKKSKAAPPAKGTGDFDIAFPQPPPVVVFDRKGTADGKAGAAGGAGGAGSGAGAGGEGEEGEQAEEKTFLQKYWWILLGVAFLAVSSGGGGG